MKVQGFTTKTECELKGKINEFRQSVKAVIDIWYDYTDKYCTALVFYE